MRIFRTSFLVLLVILVVVGGAVFYATRNGIVERMVERQLTSAFDAKVDIDDLSFNPFASGAGFDRLAIGDKDQPMQNLLETGQASFRLEFSPLLMHKVVIDEMKIDRIGVHTAREHSAALPKAKSSPVESEKKADPAKTSTPAAVAKEPSGWDKLLAKTPKLDLSALEQRIDVTGLIKQGGLGSSRYIEEVKDSRIKMFNEWDGKLSKSGIEQDLNGLNDDIKKLDVAGIKNVNDAKAALETLKSIRARHEKLKSSFNVINFEAQRDFATLKDTWKEIDNRISDDVSSLKKLAKIGDIDTREAAQMVFGPAVLQQFATVRGYLARAKRIVAGDPSDKAPPRRTGTNIHYALERPRPPDFLIRHAGINGTLADQKTKISGDINGITTEPDAYGKPTTMQLRVVGADQSQWKISGEFDHRSKHDLDRIALNGEHLETGRVNLHDDASNPMPRAFNPRDMTVMLSMQTDSGKLRGEIAITAPRVDFAFDSAPAPNATAAVVRQVFAEIRDVHIDGQVGGTLEDPTMKLKSNIDSILSERVNRVIKQKAAEAEQQLRREIDAIVQKEKATVDAMIKEKQGALENRVKQLASTNTEVAKAVEKIQKELDKKASQGVKDAAKNLENKAKDKLKSLKF